jgi:hypothetical protein
VALTDDFGIISFGAGRCVLTPFGPNAAPNPAPIQIPVIQSVDIDISFAKKELYGVGQYPVAVARTEGKIEVKVKMGAEYTKLLNDVISGNTISTGQTLFVIDSQQTPTSHVVTITPPSSGVWQLDLGVRYQSTTAAGALGGLPLYPVTTLTASGQYTVAAGVYTFYSSDTAAAAGVQITYTYTLASVGYTVTTTNQPMGQMPTFTFDYLNNQWGTNFYMRFYNCIASKISRPFKNNDYVVRELDFDAYAGTSGNVYITSEDD